MNKIHTRIKRKYGLSTHKNQYCFFHPGLNEKKRPKTFKSEGAANSWASSHGLNPGQYSLKRVKRDKRFQIVRNNGSEI